MYFYGYRQHQPHAFVNKLNCNLNLQTAHLGDVHIGNTTAIFHNTNILYVCYIDDISHGCSTNDI